MLRGQHLSKIDKMCVGGARLAEAEAEAEAEAAEAGRGGDFKKAAVADTAAE